MDGWLCEESAFAGQQECWELGMLAACAGCMQQQKAAANTTKPMTTEQTIFLTRRMRCSPYLRKYQQIKYSTKFPNYQIYLFQNLFQNSADACGIKRIPPSARTGRPPVRRGTPGWPCR